MSITTTLRWYELALMYVPIICFAVWTWWRLAYSIGYRAGFDRGWQRSHQCNKETLKEILTHCLVQNPVFREAQTRAEA